MALSNSGISAGASPIAATHVSQYYDLFTGAMLDQIVTLKNRLTVGGNQAAADNLFSLIGVTSMSGLMQRILLALADANPTWQIDKNGKMSWGAGGASAVDTTLERAAAAYLRTNGGLDLTEVATPGAPGAGFGRLYFKVDNLPYFRAGAAGAETALATATSSTDPLLAQVWT